MLTLIDTPGHKVEAQRQLTATLHKAWQSRETRMVVWRPDKRELRINHNGTYWFASLRPDDDEAEPKYWNPFGLYRENGNLQIAVEINIPTRSNTKRVAGFFARDSESGAISLMHDGGVGGGREGVGRLPFLAWSNAKLLPVVDTQDRIRLGIIVAAVESRTTAHDLSRFIRQAVDFKLAVQNGETITPQARDAQQTFKDYYDEFSGSKRRGRMREIEYVSRHGDIVRALNKWRSKAAKPNERIVKNAYIDLGVLIAGQMTELYEVKPTCDRQTLYSAIGQVIVYDGNQAGVTKRFLVLPAGGQVPNDINEALNRQSISLIRFDLTSDKIRILG
jgi:hypothetical protein